MGVSTPVICSIRSRSSKRPEEFPREPYRISKESKAIPGQNEFPEPTRVSELRTSPFDGSIVRSWPTPLLLLNEPPYRTPCELNLSPSTAALGSDSNPMTVAVPFAGLMVINVPWLALPPDTP